MIKKHIKLNDFLSFKDECTIKKKKVKHLYVQKCFNLQKQTKMKVLFYVILFF